MCLFCIYLCKFVQMAKKFSVSIYLDTRREKKNGVFPVKLRVY